MGLYLDSAIIEEAQFATETGWLTGITTNPAILAQSGFRPEETLKKLAQLDIKEIYYQVSSENVEAMMREAEKAEALLGDKLVLKIPPTPAGYQFAVRVSADFKICITAIFHAAQALVAREIKAEYIAIYFNRATRFLGDGVSMTRDIATTLAGSGTEILAASLKSKDEGIAAFHAGAQHLTLPFDVLNTFIDDPFSKQAVEEFNRHETHLDVGQT